MAGYIVLLGILCLITPLIKSFIDGYGMGEDDDIVRWLMGMPFEQIMLMTFLTRSGIALLFMGAVLFYTERL